MFVLAALPLVALAPSPALADTPPGVNWVQSTTPGPSARESAYMAYDTSRSRTVLFGGVQEGSTANTFLSDTWEYDGTSWTQIPVSGPPAGALGQMVFDSARGVSVLFGGGNATGFLAPITWEWNGTGWTPRFTTHRPPARVWFGMTYDSVRHVVVLFGGDGQDAAGNHILLNDTWEYDGTDWRQVLPAHSPSGRYGHAMAYDSGRGKTVLFAGHDDTTGRLNDTWEYNGSDWTQVAIANPPAARFWHSMAYVPALGKVVVFGGDYFVPSVTLGPNNETWLYDGSSWQQLTPAASPSARVMAPVAYDGAHSSLVLFGGSTEVNPSQSLADTWALVVPQSMATLSASSLQFPTEPVLSVTTQNVMLTNTGNAALAISSIAAGGDFSTADNCPHPPSTLGPAAACTITVSFTPSQGNLPISGTLTVADNAPGGSQSIPLSGSGQWGELNPSPTSIDFGSALLGTPFASVTETISVPDFPTVITQLSADTPFTVNNLDCPVGLLPAGTTCHLQVGFAPALAGSYSGRLVIQDDEPGLRRVISLTGTATPPPVSITLVVTAVGTATPTFDHSIQVVAHTNAASGEASFVLNDRQIGAAQPIDGSGSAVQTITLDDSTVPAGAGLYQLVVAVHPTDTQHADNSATQPVTVAPKPEQLSWSGTGLTVAGTPAVLSANVNPAPGDAQFDFASHPAWVRFDVTDSTGTLSTYYASVSNPGTASVNVSSLAPGAFSVRARLVSASGSASPSAYVASQDLRAALAASPGRGGYVAGAGRQGAMTLGFEFAPGRVASGSMVWIDLVQVVGADGQQHQAYRIITSTSVTSVGSHSHTATVTGQAAVVFVDPTTGSRYAGLDQSTPFSVTVASDGSVVVTVNGASISLPAGSGINQL